MLGVVDTFDVYVAHLPKGRERAIMPMVTPEQDLKNQDSNNVLNGIAYDANGHRLFVTGKMWPHIFENNLIPPK